MSILNFCDETSAVVPVTATVAEAIRQMMDNDVGATAIVDEKGVVAGIFTERDVMRKVAMSGRKPTEVAVREVMTRPVVMATRDITPAEALAVMVEAHHRHLPIVDDDGKLLGTLSIRHLLQAKIDALTSQLQTTTRV
jgi:CBS domain-containing protein